MKKKALIKKIASEFDIDEIKVSEYFDHIFETLAVTFAKNKNVNVSELGKFKVKIKSDEEGNKQKTVLFSPVKKFAYDINYNFNDLSPVQIRVLDEKDIKGEAIGDEYIEDETEEIILIDFEDENVPEVKETVQEEIKKEEESEKVEEEVLIPEETAQEILQEEIAQKEEPKEEIKEDEILIFEETIHEIPGETIPEEEKERIISEIIPVIIETIEHTEPSIETVKMTTEKNRIFDELIKVVIPEISFPDFEEKIELAEIISRDKKIISEVTAIIKEEKIEEPEIPVIKEEIKEEKIEEPEIPVIEEEIKEEKIEESEIPVVEEEIKEEKIEEPKIPVIEEEIKEEKIEESEIPVVEEEIKEEKIEEPEIPVVEEEIKEEIKESEIETKKSNLELEAELLQMLDERKKILEEIKKLENAEPDDLIDISKSKVISTDKEPELFDESMIDLSKQNIFVDDDGNSLESLLNKIVDSGDLSNEQIKENKVIPEEEKEKNITKENEEQIKEDIENKEITEDKAPTTNNGIDNLENILGSLYGENNEEISLPEPKDVEPHLNNLEMKVFDKLIDEPDKKQEEKITSISEDRDMNELPNGLMSLDELENMFKDFKTEISEPQKEVEIPTDLVLHDEKKDEIKENEVVEKTETIKTYDDIFNLLEPNGKKKETKSAEVVKEEPKKRLSPGIKIVIFLGVILLIIIISIFFYERSVYKPFDESVHKQVIQPTDSTNTANKDSIIYADTNKVAVEENIIYDEEGIVIQESEKGFFIQYGNLENQFELAKKIKELKDKNINPNYEEVTVEGKQVYKIKLGPYKSLKAAKSVIPKL